MPLVGGVPDLMGPHVMIRGKEYEGTRHNIMMISNSYTRTR
jgi:hypothetical protein